MTALVLLPLLSGLGASQGTISLLFSLVFLFRGITESAQQIGSTSYLLLISPSDQRPTYVGLNNTILGLTSFLPALGGILVEVFGYQFIFGVVAGAVILALPLAWGLADTREREPRAAATIR